MPIKFRCKQCRQFLGISRSLAGQIVDCPTCGRATRVPNLDGSRKPIPKKPQLDKADSSLLNALDQLAELGKAPTSARDNTSEADTAVLKSAEAVAAEPLQPTAVIDPPALASDDSGRHPIVLEDPTEPLDSAAVLQSLADSAVPLDSVPVSAGPNRFVQVAVLLVVGAACAAGGFFAGRSGAAKVEEASTEAAEPAVTDEAKAPSVSGFTGRVTFRRAGAECLPDKGARIIAWPSGTAPEEPWPMDGFRSGDTERLVSGASKLLEELGGAMVIVGEDGTFELPLKSGGDFNVFVVSRFGSKPENAAPTDASKLAKLKMCFAEPQRLIGKTQFALIEVKYRGDGQQILDHVFEVAE